MRAKSAGVAEISEQPGNRQHTDQRYKSDNPDRNIAFSDGQCIGLSGFSRARRSHCASETSGDGFNEFEKRPNRRNTDRASTNETYFCAPGFLSECRGGRREVAGHRRKVRNAPTPTDHRADQHRNSYRQTDQVPDAEESKRQKEIISTHGSALADPKSLRHIGGQYLRLNDDREYR